MSVYKLVNKQHFGRHLRASIIALTAMLIAMPQADAQRSKKSARNPSPKSKNIQADQGSRQGEINISRSKTELPKSQGLQELQQSTAPKDLRRVRPPRSNEFYVGSSKEIEYERLLDMEIKKLYQLSQQYRKS